MLCTLNLILGIKSIRIRDYHSQTSFMRIHGNGISGTNYILFTVKEVHRYMGTILQYVLVIIGLKGAFFETHVLDHT